MKVLIDIPQEMFKATQTYYSDFTTRLSMKTCTEIIANGTPLTPDMLADLLMEERIRGELRQDISYSKDIIDNVRCRLTVDIIDRRPCFCGAELREVWRESEEANEN